MTDDAPTSREPAGASPWRFDSANPPEVWTKDMVEGLTVKQIRQLADPSNGLLSDASQESFHEVHRQVVEERSAKLKPVFDRMHADVWPTALNEKVKALQDAAAASIKFPTLQMPAVEDLRRIESQQPQHRGDIQALTDSIVEDLRHKEDRAEAQARATIEIAGAQLKLQELQDEALGLARIQAEATNDVVRAQEAVLTAVTQQLAVLTEQSQGQRQLLRSSWASGVVMEWTLFVAFVAAVATIVLGTVGTDSIAMPVWCAASIITVLLAISLGVFQFRRRQPKTTDSVSLSTPR